MSLQHFERIKSIDHLIRIRGTGPPQQLARRLNISGASLYRILAFMKDAGAPIRYSKERQTYYYNEEGSFLVKFVPS
ncbi:hypothetical protein GFS24_08845 [Chitinophaga sp. SYP-B3965]|uniref:hypothetical protein n=1 Tax=Chitinophaga sp. SYP-B3965 TaxID=2663120 RepID=UPI00129955BE|nr:hypothetical protein [Chitinophaga sp. SYP-B3965]MRG45220.1 hypothetical protein [Chitinophaga sp. SYP-B3965]